MGLVMPRMELLDRQIIDADELDAQARKICRAVGREIRVIAHEPAFANKVRVARRDENSRMTLELVHSQLLFADRHHVRLDAHQHGRTHQDVERKGVDRHAIVEEMLRRVDVGPGVRSEGHG